MSDTDNTASDDMRATKQAGSDDDSDNSGISELSTVSHKHQSASRTKQAKRDRANIIQAMRNLLLTKDRAPSVRELSLSLMVKDKVEALPFLTAWGSLIILR